MQFSLAKEKQFLMKRAGVRVPQELPERKEVVNQQAFNQLQEAKLEKPLEPQAILDLRYRSTKDEIREKEMMESDRNQGNWGSKSGLKKSGLKSSKVDPNKQNMN